MGQRECRPIVSAAAVVLTAQQAWQLWKTRREEEVLRADQQLRAFLGVDAFGYVVAETTKECPKCGSLKPKADYSKRQWKLGGFCRACTCSYCYRGVEARAMTKEHLLPKSFGGTVTIPACHWCNQERGCSGSYKPFRRYLRAHPEAWKEALCTAKGPFDNLEAWLVDNDLLGPSLAAIASDPTNNK